MKVIVLALLLALPALSLTAQGEKLNNAFLLRQMKRFPAAGFDGDGRITAAEWREFQASARLKKEMTGKEPAAQKTKGDSGVRVPPTHTGVAYGPLPEQRLIHAPDGLAWVAILHDETAPLDCAQPCCRFPEASLLAAQTAANAATLVIYPGAEGYQLGQDVECLPLMESVTVLRAI